MDTTKMVRKNSEKSQKSPKNYHVYYHIRGIQDRSGPVLTGPLQVAACVRTGLGPQDWTDGIGPGPVLVGFGPGPDCGP